MREIGQAYESANPGITVMLNFASSGALLQQIIHGAPVDVFASASQQFMDEAERHELLLPGEGDDVVLCLPGLTRNCKDFEALARHLAPRHRVLTPARRPCTPGAP